MQRFSSSAVGIERGSVLLFSAFDDQGPMWTGHGPRVSRKTISFSEAFIDPPVVQVSISMWDVQANANLRADITAENISVDGFEIVFRTWGDTKIARIRSDWLAIGGQRHEDDFEV